MSEEARETGRLLTNPGMLEGLMHPICLLCDIECQRFIHNVDRELLRYQYCTYQQYLAKVGDAFIYYL